MPGPGFIHLPAWVDDDYLEQLASERAFRRYVKGRGLARVWELIGTRNEALDLEVYSLAALYVMGPRFIRRLPERVKLFSSSPDVGPATPEPIDPESSLRAPGKALPRRRGAGAGWVNSWRKP
jgi:phage terminase large subunit GpA-like protein